MQKLWREKHRDRLNAIRRKQYKRNSKKICADTRKNRVKYLRMYKNYYYKKFYGITLADKEAMIKKVGSKCQICLLVKDLVVDHSHAHGQVRGLICADCNKGLGWFKDSVRFLMSAIDYLSKTEMKNIAGA
jgi:5-methylcytosine-specific restriction endonuclease McrA